MAMKLNFNLAFMEDGELLGISLGNRGVLMVYMLKIVFFVFVHVFMVLKFLTCSQQLETAFTLNLHFYSMCLLVTIYYCLFYQDLL